MGSDYYMANQVGYMASAEWSKQRKDWDRKRAELEARISQQKRRIAQLEELLGTPVTMSIEVGPGIEMPTTVMQQCCDCNRMTSSWSRIYHNIYCPECFSNAVSTILVENANLKKQQKGEPNQ